MNTGPKTSAPVKSRLKRLEEKAKGSTNEDLAKKVQEAIRLLRKQRHLSQEELDRMVTI